MPHLSNCKEANLKKHSGVQENHILPYSYRLNRSERLWIALACLGAMFFYAILFTNEINQLKKADESAFILRTQLLDEFVNSRRSFVDGMARLAKQNMSLPLDPGLIEKITDHHEYGVYSIGRPDYSGYSGMRFLGNLTGIGHKAGLDRATLREIQAALLLDPLLAAQLRNDPELIWAYYTSKRQFLYLAPGVAVEDYRFAKEEYQREFWYQAVPPANPYLRTVVTSLYTDSVGKGEMISISKPVLLDTQIIGVVSADIGIATLQEILTIGNSAGHTILLDKAGQLIASNHQDTHLHLEKINLAAITGRPRFFDDGWWTKKSLADETLYILHHQEAASTLRQALQNTGHLLIILLLLLIMTFLLFKLRHALHLVTNAMRTDPLTGLLNRRGFFEDVKQMISLCYRQELQLSVLMLDIDHFKIVNDKYGHAAGDKVLIELAALLKDNLRDIDSLCRWGGEEFAAFMPGTSGEIACNIAERIRQKAKELLHCPDGTPVTVSIGVAEAICDQSIDLAIEGADAMMYEAKKAGRDKVICH
jgi:diguanylate cyclase (GGDEF)-like protein